LKITKHYREKLVEEKRKKFEEANMTVSERRKKISSARPLNSTNTFKLGKSNKIEKIAIPGVDMKTPIKKEYLF